MLIYKLFSSFKIMGAIKDINIKPRAKYQNLTGNFGATHLGNMHAHFQVSCFTGLGGEWGDRQTRDVTPNPYTNI